MGCTVALLSRCSAHPPFSPRRGNRSGSFPTKDPVLGMLMLSSGPFARKRAVSGAGWDVPSSGRSTGPTYKTISLSGRGLSASLFS